MSSQPVHLQYNSPMQLYSKESAEEQFQQQVGSNSPIPLPAPDKHFDPSKSATLKYLKEGDHSSFGQNFAEKIAAAEAPRVPYEQEPGWARYAREKSERARSRTPADPSMHRSAAATPQPHHVHHETPWEHAEKSRTYTHSTHPEQHGPAYYQVQHHDRQRRDHSVGADRGYELGGMDYTKGLPIEKGMSDYYYESHRSRKEDTERRRPGYELGGSDFGKGYVAAGPYHGHGPDPPRLRSHYSADPRSSCNVYSAPNIDGVDANLLVGDTLSNQKIRHEVRHIDQSKFGTSFAPAEGFKRDHHFHRSTPPPTEPVTFSSSGKQPRSASAGYSSGYTYRSSAPVEQQNVWSQRQSETDREIYTNEPNWSRTVQQRRGAWERKAFDTEARVNLPATAKVPPPQPPAWHRAAQQKHQVWQSAADHVQGHQPYQTQQQYQQQQQYTQQQQQQQYQPAPPQQHYTESHSTVQSQQHYQPPVTTYQVSGNNAPNVANTGFNQNQMEYMQSHLNKYNAGQQYAGQMGDSYSSTSRFGGSSQHQESTYKKSSSTHEERSVPVQPAVSQFQQSYQKSSSTTHEEKSAPAPVQPPVQSSQFQQSYKKSSSSTREEKSIPVQPVQSQFQESSYHKSSSSSREERTVPVKPVVSSYQENYHKSSSSTSETTRAVPVQPVQQSQQFQSYKSSSSTQESRAAPVQQPAQTQYQESYKKTTTTEESTGGAPLRPVQPIQTNFQESLQKSSSSHETSAAQPRFDSGLLATHGGSGYTQSIQSQQMHSPGSYKSFHSSHYSKQETTTSSTKGGDTYQPQVTTTLPITKNTSYSYSSQSVNQPQQPTQIQQSSTTTNRETQQRQQQQVAPVFTQPAGGSFRAESHHSYKKEEETSSRPTSQLSHYSQHSSYNKKREERTETRTTPAQPLAPLSSAQGAENVYSKIEMNETLPLGSLSNTQSHTQGGYRDREGHDVSYKKDLQTSADPGKEYSLLKEEEKRTVETPLEPGVISRHVTTKYYKKKTVTDTTTTTAPEVAP